MRKPLILLSASHDITREGHQEIVLLNQNYALAVRAGGGCPLLALDAACAQDYALRADGLVLTGGWVSDPENLADGVVNQKELNETVRNPYDFALYQAFRDAKKPILGICQGLLAINMGQGGSLGYDLPQAFSTEHSNGISHPVFTVQDSMVERLYGPSFLVNSHHSWYVKELGHDLRITAKSPEGIPEAIEHDTLPIYGVQWHPERMRGETKNPPKGPDMTDLFRYFVKQCRTYGSGSAGKEERHV